MAFEVFGKAKMWQHQRGRAKSVRNRLILADRQSGLSYSKLSKKHGLSTMTVFNICRRESAKSGCSCAENNGACSRCYIGPVTALSRGPNRRGE